MNQQRILVIEVDRITRLMFEMHLHQAGYTMVGVASGEAALEVLAREHFDLLITDLILPDMHGLHVIAGARALAPSIAVMIVSGTTNPALTIAAINQQIQRYLLRPVLPRDLLQHVAEVLASHSQIAERGPAYRLARPEPIEEPILSIGPLQIDRLRHRVTYSGQQLLLTSCEFALLIYLAQRRGTVVSPQDITRDVLHYTCALQEARDLAKSHIHRLRRKIEAPCPGQRLIHNVRGAGYRIVDDDELASDALPGPASSEPPPYTYR